MKKALIGLGVIAGLGLLAWGFFSVYPGLIIRWTLQQRVPEENRRLISVKAREKTIQEQPAAGYVHRFDYRDLAFGVEGSGTYEVKRSTERSKVISFSTGKSASIMTPRGEATLDRVMEIAKADLSDIGVLTPADAAVRTAENLIAKSVTFSSDADGIVIFQTEIIRGMLYETSGAVVVTFSFKGAPNEEHGLILKGFSPNEIDYILGSIRRK